MLNESVFWKTALNQKSLIYDSGLGYPVYKNTVVFHSTPEPWGIHQSILHGLDTETGKEKWRLTNVDFNPKKDLQFNNVDYLIISAKVSHHFGKVSHLQKLGGFICKYTNLFDNSFS